MNRNINPVVPFSGHVDYVELSLSKLFAHK